MGTGYTMSSKLNVVKVIMNTAKCYTLTNNIMIILLKVTEKSLQKKN